MFSMFQLSGVLKGQSRMFLYLCANVTNLIRMSAPVLLISEGGKQHDDINVFMLMLIT